MKNAVSLAIKIVISFAFLALLFWLLRGDLGAIAQTLKVTDLIIFTEAIVLYVLIIIIASYRLKKLLKVQGICVSLIDASYLNFIGFFFNNFMPTAIGGDVAKAYYTSKRTKKKTASITSIIADRLFGLYSLIFIAFLALVFNFYQVKNKMVIYPILISVFLVVLFLLTLLNSNFAKLFNPVTKLFKIFKVEEKVKKLYEAMQLYKGNKKIAVQAFLISFFTQLASIFVVWVITLSLSLKISYLALLLTMPIIYTLSMLPSLNGLGIREGAFVYFLKDFIGRDKAFALSLLWLALTIVISIIGGVIYAFSSQFRSIKIMEG